MWGQETWLGPRGGPEAELAHGRRPWALWSGRLGARVGKEARLLGGGAETRCGVQVRPAEVLLGPHGAGRKSPVP